MIYFVRHGETYDNANGNILTGHGETPLNSKGIEQAKETALELKDIHFDICYCSPLVRAKQTLNEILKYHPNLNVIYDNRLKERDYGEVTGKPASVCEFNRWDANIHNPYKMETIDQMFERVTSFYKDILPSLKDKNILIVSHSGVARISYFYFHGIPANNDYSQFRLKNAEIAIFEN